MSEFSFALGEIVRIAPAGIVGASAARGRVIGHTRYLDGSRGYVVSCACPSTGGVLRHSLAECEIVAHVVPVG